MANIELLKQLREETGISMMECSKALEEANGDIKRAKEILREKGKEMIKGREGRATSSGVVNAYIHGEGKIGVLLQLTCESDFVAKSTDFKKLAHDISLHIAAASPLFVSPDEISEEFLDGETKIYKKQIADSGKPKEIVDKILEGKLNKYKEEVSLLKQAWVKDSSRTIQDLLDEAKAKIGENIEVAKFCRYAI